MIETMSLFGPDWIAVLLRTMVYIGTIASAGGVLVRATLDTSITARTLDRQIFCGLGLLALCEPLRYVAFQLSIAQGDWAMAFDPAMRWMGMETPLGHAAGVRFTGAGIILIGLLLWRPLAIAGAVLAIVSFLLEGHTLSHEHRPLLAALLFAHLAMVHWWLGALLPLRAALSERNDPQATASLILNFAGKAIWAVGILTVTGIIMLGELTDWRLAPASAYQQGFALKLASFAALITIAAVNKLRWTPILIDNPAVGQRGLRTSIGIETIAATTLLFATALATSFPPAI